MIDMLTNLNNSTPCMWCKLLFTIITLHVCFNKFSHKCLFYFCFVVQLFLYCYFDFDSFRVFFSPNETSIDDLSPIQSFYFFQQNRKKLFTISFTSNPWGSHVTMTKSTEIDDSFFGDANCNICFCKHACLTNIRKFWLELDTTHWT